jgi:FKBP-type peptidyl-prolyl cis-trans isomerase FkpA
LSCCGQGLGRLRPVAILLHHARRDILRPLELPPPTTVTFTLQLVPPAAGRALCAARRALFAPMIAVTVLLSACGTDSTAPSTPSNPALETFNSTLGVNIAAMTKRSDDLYIQDLVVGTGADATAGRTIRVTYSGWLVNGSRFDSNVGGPAFSFRLGFGQVIAGWDQGVVGMKVGGKRKLVIGSALGYGSQGAGSIPANATLVFDVEVLGVQ